MDSTADFTSGAGFGPSYQIDVYHPDTRAKLAVPLEVLTGRIERALRVEVETCWIPALVALADGLFMQEEAVVRRVHRVSSMVLLDPDQTVARLPDVLEALARNRIVEQRTIEDLYHIGRLDELDHPRVWELNGWWDKLYGAIPTRSEWDDEDGLDGWVEGPPRLEVGKISLPLGVSPERDEVRLLLEKRVLSQYEMLYRLRLSWHR